MSSPTTLLGDVRAVASDYPRDRMPPGFVWELTDWIPALLDAQLTARGGWRWASDVVAGPIEGGIYAPFMAGEALLIAGGGHVYEVDQIAGALTDRGPAPSLAQNPVMIQQKVVFPDRTKAAVPKYVERDPTTAAWSNGVLDAAPKAAYADTYKGRLVLANIAGNDPANGFSDSDVRFSRVNMPNVWDPLSWEGSSQPVTGIKALRNALIIFHKGSMERLRGNSPEEANVTADTFIEPLYDVGTVFAQSIVHWNDNVVFADSRGVYISDGATTRNLCTQGGIQQLWRQSYVGATAIAAGLFLDYYICSVVRPTGSNVLICDLVRRQWFQFSNIPALCFIPSQASFTQMWAGLQGHNRLAGISTCFFHTVNDQVDADGDPVLPVIESGWNRLSKKEGRKRMRHLYLSYEAQAEAGVTDAIEALKVSVKRAPEVVAEEIGRVKTTHGYTRRKLPVNKFPFGLAIRIEQIVPTAITRLYMVDLEAEAAEESRVTRNLG